MANYLERNINTRDIFLNFHFDDIFNYCRTSTQAVNLCQDDTFWIEKAQLDFKVSPQFFRNTDLTAAQRYLELLTNNDGVAIGSEDYSSIKECMKRAIKQDKENVVKHLSGLGFNDYDVMILEYTANGNLGMVIKYLPLSESYFIKEKIAEIALINNKIEIFEYVENSNYYLNPIKSVLAAARSGNIELYNFIYSKYSPNLPNLDVLLKHIALSGNQYFMHEVLNKTEIINWDNLLSSASRSKNRQLFRYVYEAGRQKGHNFDKIILLESAAVIGDNELLYSSLDKDSFEGNLSPRIKLNIINYVIKRGREATQNFLKKFGKLYEESTPTMINSIYIEVARTNNKDFLDYILVAIPNKGIDLNRIVYGAAQGGSKRLVNYILNKYPDYKWDWNSLLRAASLKNDKFMFGYLYNIIPLGSGKLAWKIYINNAKSKDFFVFLYSLMSDETFVDYNHVAVVAVSNGKNQLFYYILGITNDLKWNEIIHWAHRYKNQEILDFINNNPQLIRN